MKQFFFLPVYPKYRRMVIASAIPTCIFFLNVIYYQKRPINAYKKCLMTQDARTERTLSFEDHSILIAVIVFDCQPGYMRFTSPLLPSEKNATRIHVFDSGNTCHTMEDFIDYYGIDYVHHKLQRKISFREAAMEAIGYFWQHGNGTVGINTESMLLVTPDVLFFSHTIDTFFQLTIGVDIFQTVRTESNCDPTSSTRYTKDHSRLIGSFVSKSFARLVLDNPILLQPCGERDVKVVKDSALRIRVPEESLAIRIGQKFNGDSCSRFVETANFNRCKLPLAIQQGIEFYLEKCNKSNDFFEPRIEMNQPLTRETTKYSKPAISYSLYGGNNPRYIRGALDNSELIKIIFPGWRMWIFYDESVPCDVLRTLCSRGVKLVKLTDKVKNKMAWRFAVASAPVERFLVRDVDSRLSVREQEAVTEWIKSGKKFHLMRDHPCHAKFAINGGLWGATGDAIPNLLQLMENQAMEEYYLQDMDFLTSVVWPIAKRSVYQHDSFPNGKYGEVHPFPSKRRGVEHVGAVLVDGTYRHADMQKLSNALKNASDIDC